MDGPNSNKDPTPSKSGAPGGLGGSHAPWTAGNLSSNTSGLTTNTQTTRVTTPCPSDDDDKYTYVMLRWLNDGNLSQQALDAYDSMNARHAEETHGGWVSDMTRVQSENNDQSPQESPIPDRGVPDVEAGPANSQNMLDNQAESSSKDKGKGKAIDTEGGEAPRPRLHLRGRPARFLRAPYSYPEGLSIWHPSTETYEMFQTYREELEARDRRLAYVLQTKEYSRELRDVGEANRARDTKAVHLIADIMHPGPGDNRIAEGSHEAGTQEFANGIQESIAESSSVRSDDTNPFQPSSSALYSDFAGPSLQGTAAFGTINVQPSFGVLANSQSPMPTRAFGQSRLGPSAQASRSTGPMRTFRDLGVGSSTQPSISCAPPNAPKGPKLLLGKKAVNHIQLCQTAEYHNQPAMYSGVGSSSGNNVYPGNNVRSGHGQYSQARQPYLCQVQEGQNSSDPSPSAGAVLSSRAGGNVRPGHNACLGRNIDHGQNISPRGNVGPGNNVHSGQAQYSQPRHPGPNHHHPQIPTFGYGQGLGLGQGQGQPSRPPHSPQSPFPQPPRPFPPRNPNSSQRSFPASISSQLPPWKQNQWPASKATMSKDWRRMKSEDEEDKNEKKDKDGEEK